MHKDVLAARYRDVAPDVRATVVATIGELCHERPSDFLQDSHLRYIAWALSDEVCDAAATVVIVNVVMCCYSAVHYRHVVPNEHCPVHTLVAQSQSPAVRSTAVDAVIALYQDRANASPLQPFKARFLQRFQELAYDVDDTVATKGVRWGTPPFFYPPAL